MYHTLCHSIISSTPSSKSSPSPLSLSSPPPSFPSISPSSLYLLSPSRYTDLHIQRCVYTRINDIDWSSQTIYYQMHTSSTNLHYNQLFICTSSSSSSSSSLASLLSSAAASPSATSCAPSPPIYFSSSVHDIQALIEQFQQQSILYNNNITRNTPSDKQPNNSSGLHITLYGCNLRTLSLLNSFRLLLQQQHHHHQYHLQQQKQQQQSASSLPSSSKFLPFIQSITIIDDSKLVDNNNAASADANSRNNNNNSDDDDGNVHYNDVDYSNRYLPYFQQQLGPIISELIHYYYIVCMSVNYYPNCSIQSVTPAATSSSSPPLYTVTLDYGNNFPCHYVIDTRQPNSTSASFGCSAALNEILFPRAGSAASSSSSTSSHSSSAVPASSDYSSAIPVDYQAHSQHLLPQPSSSNNNSILLDEFGTVIFPPAILNSFASPSSSSTPSSTPPLLLLLLPPLLPRFHLWWWCVRSLSRSCSS